MRSQFEKDTTVAQQRSCSLGYMDVPWLQRHRLVYMGFVHCGSTFQMTTHYGTNLLWTLYPIWWPGCMNSMSVHIMVQKLDCVTSEV